MKKYDNIKIKATILAISLLLTAFLIVLYFADNSLEWNAYKILSCIIVSIWTFFLIPAIRVSYILNKDKTMAEWFMLGLRFGASGIMPSVLFAPYFGFKYYFNKEN